jgi:hypothetical protein
MRLKDNEGILIQYRSRCAFDEKNAFVEKSSVSKKASGSSEKLT